MWVHTYPRVEGTKRERGGRQLGKERKKEKQKEEKIEGREVGGVDGGGGGREKIGHIGISLD